MIELAIAQATDLFRIGLLAALFFTMLRTRAASGVLRPLALGALFVAVIIPVVMGGVSGMALLQPVAVGVAVNAVWLAVMWLVWQAVVRARG